MEWDTSRLSTERRAYLDEGWSFERIAARVVGGATVISNDTKRYCDAPLGEKDGRQIVIVVRCELQTCDLLYNAPDGMRGRYWQSPDLGFAATKHLISGLLPRLMSFAVKHPPTPPESVAQMSVEDINVSLECMSAKVWPRETDNGKWLLEDDRLEVPRWRDNEAFAKKYVGWWRKSPTCGDLEIKGALIGADRTEYIPPEKRDRSCQIHKFGFT